MNLFQADSPTEYDAVLHTTLRHVSRCMWPADLRDTRSLRQHALALTENRVATRSICGTTFNSRFYQARRRLIPTTATQELRRDSSPGASARTHIGRGMRARCICRPAGQLDKSVLIASLGATSAGRMDLPEVVVERRQLAKRWSKRPGPFPYLESWIGRAYADVRRPTTYLMIVGVAASSSKSTPS